MYKAKKIQEKEALVIQALRTCVESREFFDLKKARSKDFAVGHWSSPSARILIDIEGFSFGLNSNSTLFEEGTQSRSCLFIPANFP